MILGVLAKRAGRRFQAGLLLPLLLSVALGSAAVPTAAAQAQESGEATELTKRLGIGWFHLNAGSLERAQDAFVAAHKAPGGVDSAEVHYAVAGVYWARRNASAVHHWLQRAVERRATSRRWDGGADGSWDDRIDGRLRYLQRHFGRVELLFPQWGDPLPPLADPRPSEPLLADFISTVPRQLQSAAQRGGRSRTVLLPVGSYWVGGKVVELTASGTASTAAAKWQLESARGDALSAYKRKKAVLKESQDRGEAAHQTQMAALRSAAATLRKEGGPAPSEVGSRPSAEAGDVSSEQIQEAAALLRALPPPVLLTYPSVTPQSAPQLAAELSTFWQQPTVHLRFVAQVPDSSGSIVLRLVDRQAGVQIDGSGLLRIEGTVDGAQLFPTEWMVGSRGRGNVVELWCDGRVVQVAINGIEYGPAELGQAGSAGSPLGRWAFSLSPSGLELRHVLIETWRGRVDE